ncbi:MAG TPA: acyl-CoA reductase [Bacteroidales bacterium]|nr:acyl-CoA reductase [Bacteroidales bacterium]
MKTDNIINRLADWAEDFRIGTRLFATEDLPEAFQQAMIHNKWFTKENIISSVNALAEMISDKACIEQWLKKYPEPTSDPKKILLILAGNIPAVGFHDVLCTLLSGHSAEIKLSSDDKFLIPWMLRAAEKHFPEWSSRIHYHEGLMQDFDAVIATGSNQSARTFQNYFSTKPNIIRHSRSSIAVVHDSDSDEDLKKLGNDVFMYFGLGCRNVSLVFIPKDFDKQRLFDAFLPWMRLADHNAFANNYVYYKSYFSLSKEEPLDGSFYLLRENRTTSAPVAIVHYAAYENISEVKDYIAQNSERIQCVVSAANDIENAVKPGQAQSPHIDDYADGVDTMEFLTAL